MRLLKVLRFITWIMVLQSFRQPFISQAFEIDFSI